MTTQIKDSSWIESIGYLRTGTDTWITVFTRKGTAILYTRVPSTLPGLIAAGRVRTKDGERLSHGAAYNRFLRGKYLSQTITDPVRVDELRQAMRGKEF